MSLFQVVGGDPNLVCYDNFGGNETISSIFYSLSQLRTRNNALNKKDK